MKVRCLTILFLLAALGLAPTAQAALSFDVAVDFSTTSNVDRAWTYGYCDAAVGPAGFTAYNHSAPLPGYESSGVVGWAIGDAGWGDPNVNKNTSGDIVAAYDITWAPDMVAMGGDGGWVYATQIRWTCPEDGIYDVDAMFTGIQNTGALANWLVSKNSSTAWLTYSMYMGYGDTLPYSDQLTLVAGDTLDFISHGMQHTALSATINQVPEPSTFALMAFGLLGFVAYVRRAR